MAGLLSDRFDPNVRRLGLFPYPQGALTGQKGPVDWSNWVAPQFVVDAIKSMELPGRALRGENISARDITKMAMDTMGGGGLLSRAVPTGDVGGLLGINVFHGGPHRWAPEPGYPQGRPRMDKIGTGEGAQAYGHGFYSAEAPGVATGYRDALQRMGNPSVKDRTGSFSELLSKYYPASEGKYSQQVEVNGLVFQGPDQVVDGIKGGLIKKGDVPDEIFSAAQTFLEPGTLYKLDIPDADAAKYLDYDAPLSQQPENVKKALKKWGNFPDNMKGSAIYEAIASALAKPPFDSARRSTSNPEPSQAASEALRKMGIPGLKYFDQGSRRSVEIFVDGKRMTPNGARGIAEKESGWLVGQLVDRGAGAITFGADPKEAIIKESIYQGRTFNKDEIDAAVKKAITFMDRLREGGKTRNYVTWDQDVLDRTKILERDGKPTSANAEPRLPSDIRPAKENLATVVDANTVGGRVAGDETVSIDLLAGGASRSARAQKDIDNIADSMSGPDGFIERLIVDQDNNVIEGAHRLEALRKLGVKEVPVTRIIDPQASFTGDDIAAMKNAMSKVSPIHSDHKNQIITQLGEMLADPDVAGDFSKVSKVFDLPKGFEKHFEAALKILERQ